MMTLYDFMGSGNGYKVRLVLAHLGLPYKLVERDILKGETRTPEFLAKNPNGRIPTLQLEDGSHLFESNAIIWYLAEGTRLAPKDRRARAEALQWMFFEQYSHEPYIAVARFWKHFFAKLTPQQEIANNTDDEVYGLSSLICKSADFSQQTQGQHRNAVQQNGLPYRVFHSTPL